MRQGISNLILQLESSVTSNALTALYCTFAFFGFIAGTALNYCNASIYVWITWCLWYWLGKVGPRATLAFGGTGYALYSISLLMYNHTANSGFVIASGAILGICAAFLWCAQGTVMMVSFYRAGFPRSYVHGRCLDRVTPRKVKRVVILVYFGGSSIW